MSGSGAGVRFLTVTLDPAIDLRMSIPCVMPTRKLRCTDVRRSAGGGGINVARVLKRLGASVTAMFGAGGSEGERLCRMLAEEGVPFDRVSIEGETRESFNVLETQTGREFRFVMPGPYVTERERRDLMERVVRDGDGAVVVLSGSLPPGVPADFYAELTHVLEGRATRVVLDTSGEALEQGSIGVDLIKPSIDELEDLVGRPLTTRDEQVRACRDLIAAGRTNAVALTRGAEGAMLVLRGEAHAAAALPMATRSAVGAGNSFLAALVWAQAEGLPATEALAMAVAAPSAGLVDQTMHGDLASVQALAKAVTVERVD